MRDRSVPAANPVSSLCRMRSVGRLLIEEPIHSLRSPGGAGKCGKVFVTITPGAARRLALPGLLSFTPAGFQGGLRPVWFILYCSSGVAGV